MSLQPEIIKIIKSPEFIIPLSSDNKYQVDINRFETNINLSYNLAIEMINKQEQNLSENNAIKQDIHNNSLEFSILQNKIKQTETQIKTVRERPHLIEKTNTPIQSLLSDIDKQLIPKLLITSSEINDMSIILLDMQKKLESRLHININDIDNLKNISPNNYIHLKAINHFINDLNKNAEQLPEYIFNFDNFLPIVNKLNTCRGLLLSNNLINHKVDCSIYRDVFFISDIHSDLRKFISLLYSGGFIELINFDPYNDDFNSDFINKITWIKNNSLLVIIGDLVDGTRISKIEDKIINTGTVNDKVGNFEVLLHILIYNLRLQALLLNSNILFTYGNHDLIAIYKDSNDYIGYVSPETKKYFYNSMSLRANVLKYFYALSPYIILQLSTPYNSREILCVHGGLHTGDGTNIFNKSEIINFFKFQEILSLIGVFSIDIYKESNYNLLNQNDKIERVISDNQFKSTKEYKYYDEFKSKTNKLIDLYNKYIFSTDNNKYLLISRFYTSNDQDAVCKSIEDFGDDIKMIVVGHCPTNGYDSLAKIMNKPENHHLYEKCDRLGNIIASKGCVVANCSDNQNPGAPTLAFVDTAISSAFRSRIISTLDSINVNLSDKEKLDTSLTNSKRNNEMLHLHHDPTLGGINKYYNVVLRLVLPNIISKDRLPQTKTIDIDKEPHEIVLYKAAPKTDHYNKYRKQMKYLKYKLKYYYLVQKS